MNIIVDSNFSPKGNHALIVEDREPEFFGMSVEEGYKLHVMVVVVEIPEDVDPTTMSLFDLDNHPNRIFHQ